MQEREKRDLLSGGDSLVQTGQQGLTPRTGLSMRPPNWTLGWGPIPHKWNGTEGVALGCLSKKPPNAPSCQHQAPAPQQPESASWSFEWWPRNQPGGLPGADGQGLEKQGRSLLPPALEFQDRLGVGSRGQVGAAGVGIKSGRRLGWGARRWEERFRI